MIILSAVIRLRHEVVLAAKIKFKTDYMKSSGK